MAFCILGTFKLSFSISARQWRWLNWGRESFFTTKTTTTTTTTTTTAASTTTTTARTAINFLVLSFALIAILSRHHSHYLNMLATPTNTFEYKILQRTPRSIKPSYLFVLKYIISLPVTKIKRRLNFIFRFLQEN